MSENQTTEKLGALLNQVWARAIQNYAKHTQSTMAGGYNDVRFLALALCGEAGELANVIKKQWRGDSPYIPQEAGDELADVLAYTMMLAHHLDMDADALLSRVSAKQDAFVEKMRALYQER